MDDLDVSESEEDEEMAKMPLQSALRKRVRKVRIWKAKHWVYSIVLSNYR